LAVKSAAWYGATRLWAQVLAWTVTIVLARLLTPGDYGLFAITLSVLAVFEMLQEFGLGEAIVQRQNLTARQLNAMFWMVVGISAVLGGLTFSGAGLLGHFYGDPRLASTLRVLSLSFLLNAMGMVPFNLLTKAIDLRRRSLAEALGSAASALVALTLAYLGFGVWALVLGHLARSVVLNAALFAFAGWVPGREVAFEGMKSVMGFGMRITGTHLVGNLAPTVTTFVLARLLGTSAVGLYAMAQGLAEAPHRISTAMINQVSFPVFSRLQDDPVSLAGYFLRISKYLAVVSLPVQVGVMLVAPDLVIVVLSAKWQEMVVPFQIFCMESALVILTLAASPLLTARGKVDLLLRRSVLSFFVMTLATVVGIPFGLVGVAAARLVVMLPLRLTLLLPSLREMELPITAFLVSLRSPLFAVALMGTTVVFVRDVVLPSAGHLERLVLTVLAGAITYPAALLLLDRGLGPEVRGMARDLFSTSRA
jgi:O-antigen/teichoic acid export membrane protein